MNRLYLAVLCLLLASGCPSSGSDTVKGGGFKHPDNQATFLSGATFIAGDGSAPIEEATIILDGDTIYKVGKKNELSPPKLSAQRPGLEGHYIIPMVVNLSAYPGLSIAGRFDPKKYSRDTLTADLNRYAYYGVAAVAAGTDSDGLAVQVRDEQRQGKATGALLHTAGRGIAAKGGSEILGSLPIRVATEDEARKAVGELVDRKADIIMLWAEGMKAATSAAVVDEAHKQKLRVFADAPSLTEAKDLAKAGVDALIASVRDGEVDEELASLLKEKKVAYAPALSSLEARFIYGEHPRWRGESAMLEVYKSSVSAYLGDDTFIKRYKRESDTETAKKEFGVASRNLKKLAASGVTIAFASGSGLPYALPGYFEHHEMDLMAAAGMAPMDVIKAATLASAAALGAADLGALTQGKKANFMIISEDPLKEIAATRGIDEVWINGKHVEQRQSLITEIEPIRITPEERKEEEERDRLEAIKKAEDKEDHYGNKQFILTKPRSRSQQGCLFRCRAAWECPPK